MILLFRFVAFVAFFVAHHATIAQQSTPTPPPSPITLGFDGQVVVTSNGESFFLNFGGPGIRAKKGVWAVSVNMLPSLRFYEDTKTPAPLITPSLGAGLQFYYKRLILCSAAYYIANKTNWTITGGLGFRLSK